MSDGEFKTPNHHRITIARNAAGEVEARVVNALTGVIRPLGEQLSRDIDDWQKALSWQQQGELIAAQLLTQVPGGPGMLQRLGHDHPAMLPYAERINENQQVIEQAQQMAQQLEVRIGTAADHVAEGHGVTLGGKGGPRQV